MKNLITCMAMACCLYTTKLFVSPVYSIFIVLTLLGVGIVCIKRHRFSFPLESKLLFLFVTYATASEIYYHSGASTYINLLTGGAAFILIRGTKKYSSKFWESRIILAAKVFAALAVADTAYRLTHPQGPTAEAVDALEMRDEGHFYLYKFGSLMFSDSNTTAIISVIFLFAILQLGRGGRKVFLLSFIYACLVLLSLSRAAILATALVLVFHLFRSHILRMAALSIAVFSFGVFFLTQVMNDGSFLTKFDIVRRIADYYNAEPTAGVQLIFGVGYDNAIEAIGMYTHILVATLLFEGGLISLILFAWFIFEVARRSPSTRHLIAATLLLSMSYFLYVGGPFFYVVIAFLMNYDSSSRRERSLASRAAVGTLSGGQLSFT